MTRLNAGDRVRDVNGIVGTVIGGDVGQSDCVVIRCDQVRYGGVYQAYDPSMLEVIDDSSVIASSPLSERMSITPTMHPALAIDVLKSTPIGGKVTIDGVMSLGDLLWVQGFARSARVELAWLLADNPSDRISARRTA